MTATDNTCARDGCSFSAELVLINERPLSAVYCGEACADFAWLRRGLQSAEASPDIAACWQNLNALERLLNERGTPFEVGSLLGALHG